jgi:SAM-dependent methyltransferase
MARMVTQRREGYAGTGPGSITPDGCAVDLYLRMPAKEEPDIIEAAVPAGASILELGAGAGRVTRALLQRGFTVTAVDESADMLAHIEGARTVQSSIEDLELTERFDVVMLASFLINTGVPGLRDTMLRTCRRHVADGGCVLIQREPDGLHENLPRESKHGDAVYRTVSSTPVGDGVRSVYFEYVFPDVTWTQTFQSRPTTREEFEQALADCGLAVDSYLTENQVWVRVVPV